MNTLTIDKQLIRNIENAEAQYWSEYYIAASQNLREKLGIKTELVSDASCYAMSGVDTLAFNRVVGFGIDYEVDESRIDKILDFYKKSNASRFFLQLSPIAKPEWSENTLLNSGFTYYNNWAKFVKRLNDPVSQPGFHAISSEAKEYQKINSQLSLRIAEPCEADIFDHIIRSSFDWQDDAAYIFSHTMGRPGWKHYFACQENLPIAAASMFTCGKYASMAIAGTLPQHRGKGAQGALIRQRINDAYIAGCDYLVVETAEDKPGKPSASNRNMQRMGFEQVYLRPNFIYYL